MESDSDGTTSPWSNLSGVRFSETDMESDELVLLIFGLDCSELFMGERLPEAVTDRESDDGVRFSGEFLERGDAEYVFWGLERNRRDGDGERGLLTLDALCS